MVAVGARGVHAPTAVLAVDLTRVPGASAAPSGGAVPAPLHPRPGTGTVGPVDQRVSLITLGVADVTRSRAFYEALGWRGQETQGTVFFQAGGMAVVLWSRRLLAEDSGIEDDGGSGFGGIALAHNVRSAAEVDDVVARAEAAGATVTRRPAETFYGGYAGCFTDPDGHVWEVAHNPGFTLTDDGALVLPDMGGDPPTPG